MTTELVIVKQDPTDLTETERDIARRVIFGMVDGLNAQHKKRWRRFWNWAFRAEPGELVTFITNRQRSGPFHRRHFLMEQRLFDAQERFDDFEQLRCWLKVGAGFVDWLPGPKGAVVPIPKSMSYAALDEDGMQELHAAIVAFMRTPRVAKLLWPHLGDAAGADMIERVLMEFDE